MQRALQALLNYFFKATLYGIVAIIFSFTSVTSLPKLYIYEWIHPGLLLVWVQIPGS